MNSKTMDLFLNNESDDDILEAQYVIVSNRIRHMSSGRKNIIQAGVLFPDSNTVNSVTNEEFERKYYEQLEDNITLIAILVKASLNDTNIIFLCSKKEVKLGHYLKLLSRFIYNEFDIPMYSYKDFAQGLIKEVSYDPLLVYKKCEKVIKVAKEKEVVEKIRRGSKLSKGNKKRLKKILKKNDLYRKGMTNHEMVNIAFNVFIDSE